MANQSQLELYYMPSCPYCRKVLTFMHENDIDLPLHDINSDMDAETELVKVGGKRQVPCLFIDGAPLYESEDIIDYLSDKFAAPRKTSK